MPYIAGLDNDSRPILVLNACNLPDPEKINYDLILAYILTRLDEFVENDYVLIFFSSPAHYRPAWMWLMRAYRALDRKYKKNLKALYVVHLTRTYRIIFDLANRITSPKFARKLHYFSMLQELYGVIRLSSQFIPKEVIDYDTRLPPMMPSLAGRSRSLSWSPSSYSASKRKAAPPSVPPLPSLAFGLTLENLARRDNIQEADQSTYIPSVVRHIVNHLETRGLDTEGLFRKSPATEELSRAKAELNRGELIDLARYDINVAASLLKVFLKELPQPLVTAKFCSEIGRLPDPETCSTDIFERVRNALVDEYKGKPYQRNLLMYLLRFLDKVVQNADKNLMTAHNLAVVFTPALIHDGNSSTDVPATQEEAMATAAVYLQRMSEGTTLIRYLIMNQSRFFPLSNENTI
ncbi:Rho GTPase activation protein [Dichotomocladium elegans]|nr:Rho GTPase activation protein [Dichotomocladium elegans]